MSTATKRYYEDIASEYAEPGDHYDARYHEKRYATAVKLLDGLHGRLFDFGCGTGELLRRLPAFSVEGCDFSPAMIAIAKRLVPNASVTVGGLEYFLNQSGPYDLVVSLNTLPYLTASEEAAFYEHARKIAPRVLASHSNALFDLVTFNRYTVDFFRREFSGLVPPEAMEELPALLTNADHPPRGDKNASERELVPKRSVDPFTYQPAGFAIADMAPLNFFPLPPAILQSRKEWQLAQPDIELSGTLAKLFCSQFQMLLRRD